jgi:choline dehydrogenase-like flavoprotein
MASFDYDVVIIGSGFGGSVAALRAAEKGYRVGVMESGRRWKDEDIPKTQRDLPHFLWFPAAELYDRARRRPSPRVRRSLHLHRRGLPAVRRSAHRHDDHVPRATAPGSTSPPEPW